MIKIKKSSHAGKIVQSFEDRSMLSKDKPVRSLTISLMRSFGRDAKGHISVRHKGGGVKKLYRIISTLDQFKGQKAIVQNLQYDPYRTAFIALIEFENGKKAYIVAPEKIKVGQTVTGDEKTDVNFGNRMMLKNIPTGTQINTIQFRPESKSNFATSAGASATIMALEAGYALIKMPSSEVRKINEKCFASIGQVSNSVHSRIRIGKAGRNRKIGIRPSVRGKAMHPAAHPHGGGEGVNSIGLKYPKSPWGQIAIGGKTRRKKFSDKFIVTGRKKKKR